MQDRTKILAAAVVFSTLVAGCERKEADDKADSAKAPAAASPAVDKKAAEAEIRSLDSSYFAGVKAKDPNVLTNAYANDAVSMPANAPTQRGHDAILKGNTDFLKLPNIAMTGSTDEVKFSDDGTMAYDYGKYHASWTDAKGKTVTEDGKYLDVYQRVDGKWKIVADAYSGDAPPKM